MLHHVAITNYKAKPSANAPGGPNAAKHGMKHCVHMMCQRNHDGHAIGTATSISRSTASVDQSTAVPFFSSFSNVPLLLPTQSCVVQVRRGEKYESAGGSITRKTCEPMRHPFGGSWPICAYINEYQLQWMYYWDLMGVMSRSIPAALSRAWQGRDLHVPVGTTRGRAVPTNPLGSCHWR